MIDYAIEILLILLLIFTPIAFGSQLLWAFSLTELGILLIIILGAVKVVSYRLSANIAKSKIQNPKSKMDSSEFRNLKSPMTNNYILIPTVLLSLFLGLVLLQMIPLPAGIIKIISPKTYELRNQLSVKSLGHSYQSSVHSSGDKSRITNNEPPATDDRTRITNHQSPIPNNDSLITTLSFFPFGTKIEFFKWLTLAGLFIFLVHWRLSENGYRIINHLIVVIFLVGVFESLYGIFEFFSGHHHILNLDWSSRIRSVTGTFVNSNYFAGYLLMVIPLSIGYLYSRDMNQLGRPRGWRRQLSSLDGKTLLFGFGLILMILALLLSASRMGIVSLLISFSLISLLFRNPQGEQRVSRLPVLIFGLALLWGIWIGLDAVASRFFWVSEGLRSRYIIWVDTFGILKDFPFWGSGLGSFTEVFSTYQSSHILRLTTHAENDFLQIASEVGLLGAGLLLTLFLFLLLKTISGIRSLSRRKPQRYIAIGGLVGLLALMFHSIVERNIQVPANAFLYTVIWAMVLQIAFGSASKRIGIKRGPEAPDRTEGRPNP
jgi:O-antigen ligase